MHKLTKMQYGGVFNVIRGVESIHEFESKVKLWLEIVNEKTQLIRSDCRLEQLLRVTVG